STAGTAFMLMRSLMTDTAFLPALIPPFSFLTDSATTAFHPLSLHDALPILTPPLAPAPPGPGCSLPARPRPKCPQPGQPRPAPAPYGHRRGAGHTPPLVRQTRTGAMLLPGTRRSGPDQ